MFENGTHSTESGRSAVMSSKCSCLKLLFVSFKHALCELEGVGVSELE